MSKVNTGVLMCDLAGLSLSEDEKSLLLDENLGSYIGGLILFARNFESHQQVSELVASIKAVRPEIIIAVDQEGGRVQRFKAGFTPIPPMQVFAELLASNSDKALGLAKSCGWVMASEVRSTGVDLSFAPVLDVDQDFSSIIGDRAFSDQVDGVVQLAGAFMDGMHEAGMGTVGKHFPGHGAVKEDSHLTTPIDKRTFAEISARELAPFKQLMQQGKLDGVMPAHIIYADCCDKPAVFSEFWLQETLRKQLTFQGIIFSDDLCMEGAAMMGNFAQRAELALQAGCDMVLVCNNPEATSEVLSYFERVKLSLENRKSFSAYQKKHEPVSLSEIKKTEAYKNCEQAGLFA